MFKLNSIVLTVLSVFSLLVAQSNLLWLHTDTKFIKDSNNKPFRLGAIGTIWQSELYVNLISRATSETPPIDWIKITKKKKKILKGSAKYEIEEIPENDIKKIINIKNASDGKIVTFSKFSTIWSFIEIPLKKFYQQENMKLQLAIMEIRKEQQT